MDRKEFIQTLGAAGMVTALSMAGCSPRRKKRTTASVATGDIPTDRMEYRRSSQGDRVSLLGYGCMRWPSRPGTFGPNENEIDQEQVNHLVDYALEHGVNFYDTSPVYCKGFSEEATGIALSRYPRERYLLSSKLSNFAPETWTYDESVKMYHETLRKLQTDYLDYYLLHSVGGGKDAMATLRSRYIDNGILDFLLAERKAGRIRHLGFSYHGDIRVFDYLLSQHSKYHWDMVLIQLNYVDWHYAKDMNECNTNAEYLLGELDKRGIPAMVMEPLLGGQLSKLPPHSTQVLKQREPECSIASWAFRFAGTHKGVMTVLSGMTYMEHLQDNLRSFAPFLPLNEEEMALLERIANEYAHFPHIPCTSCNYCMPCPYGIDIPANFRYYNTCLKEGLIQPDEQAEDYRRLRRQYLVGYGRKLQRERQADHCIGCGKCAPHCPQGIDIPNELRRMDHYVEALRENV